MEFTSFVRACTIITALSVPSSTLAFGLGGVSADVDVGLGQGNGIGASADVGIGGGHGAGASADVGIGGGSGVSASADIGVGGSSGAVADVDLGIGGDQGVNASAELGAGGSSGIGADVNIRLFGKAGSANPDVSTGAQVTRNSAIDPIISGTGNEPLGLSKNWGETRLLGKVLYSNDRQVLGLIDKIVKTDPAFSTVRVKLSRGSGVGRNTVKIRLPIGDYSSDAVQIGLSRAQFAQQYDRG